MIDNFTAENGGLSKDLNIRSTRSRLQLFSRIMDEAVAVPGTKFKFGLDAILQVIPVLGNIIGLVVSFFPFWEAKRSQAP